MRRSRLFLAGAAWAAVWALSGRPALAADAPTPPKLRLPQVAEPSGYAVDLTIDPGQPEFHGTVDIDVRVQQRTDVLWLDSKELKITRAAAALGGRSVPVRVIPGGTDFAGFVFDHALEPGALKLHVEFTGVMDETSTQGLFRQKDGGDWYAFTQFESTDARRAFPCFDEPSYKVAWRLTLRIPKGDSAVSNTPIASDAEEGGRRVVRFTSTPPLPSYLIALAVGPFDYVDAGRAGAHRIPVRIVTPRGKAAQARYAARTTGEVLERLEAYFGVPYPFAKLDQLAIPQTVTFGAMENAGLITWAENILLAPPAEETIRFQRVQLSINVHEMAHQWFGDLVTLAWWDDVWLNESFATWMADRTLIGWKPEWREDVRRVVDTSNVMLEDVLVTARKIRQEIKSEDDILNAFDPISYQKGAAVIAMFESWVGEEKFRAGVHHYLSAHAEGNATERDFLSAVEAASRPGVAAAFSTFLDQPGVPLVEVGLDCSAAGGSGTLRLSQKRLLPVGSKGAAPQTWEIPVCTRAGGGGAGRPGESRQCTLLAQPAAASPAAADACGGCLLANDGALGYYRTIYGGDLLGRLLAVADTKLSLAERVGLIRDVNALSQAGAISSSDALALVPRFAGAPERETVGATLRIAQDVREHLVPDDHLPEFARFVSKSYGERARALGFASRSGEDDDTRLLRTLLVPFVAREGDEPELRAEARRLALAWLGDRRAVDAELTGDVLAIAAHFGDAELFDKYLAAARAAKERRDRVRILRALGDFRDPALVRRVLDLYLTDAFDQREAVRAVLTASEAGNSLAVVWDFSKQHYDAMLEKLPREIVGEAPEVAVGFCDAAHRKDVATFFEGRIDKLPGGPRNLAQTLETIDLCITLRKTQEGSVREFLSRY